MGEDTLARNKRILKDIVNICCSEHDMMQDWLNNIGNFDVYKDFNNEEEMCRIQELFITIFTNYTSRKRKKLKEGEND